MTKTTNDDDDCGLDKIRESMQQTSDPIMQFFAFAHLPPHLAEVSAPFSVLADYVVANLPRNAEIARIKSGLWSS